MLKIKIETLNHDQQRYPTCGDWFRHGDTVYIHVSDMDNWQYELLVAIHELVEYYLCLNDGITQQEVDDFDMAFEDRRIEGNIAEPGDCPIAPYRRQHFIATNIERTLADALGVKWYEYEDKVNSL